MAFSYSLHIYRARKFQNSLLDVHFDENHGVLVSEYAYFFQNKNVYYRHVIDYVARTLSCFIYSQLLEWTRISRLQVYM